MSLGRIFCLAVFSVTLLTILEQSSKAQEFKELPVDELQRSLKLLSAHASFVDAVNKKDNRSKNPVLVSAALYERINPTTKENEKIAELVHYVYDSGKSLTSLVDLSSTKVIRVAAKEAQAIALAREERELAIKLARGVSPTIETWMAANTEQVRIEVLVPVVADRADPLFGHRLCSLTFVFKEDRSKAERVWVDLSTDTAEVDRLKDNRFLRKQ